MLGNETGSACIFKKKSHLHLPLYQRPIRPESEMGSSEALAGDAAIAASRSTKR